MKNFCVGCNYWASDSGIYMWRNFNLETVKKDFDLLVSNGVDTIRVFPLWPDFQPLIATDMAPASPFGIRGREGEAVTEGGLSVSALEKFDLMLQEAKKRDLKVIVALITGWMSGRLFMPEFLRKENPLGSPKAMVWECKFIKEFVTGFKDHDCIVAWEPGNETNVTGSVTHDSAELWVMTIVNAIRNADPTRPVLAGMHGLDCTGPWNLPMEGNSFEEMTTHPYPLFTPYCSTEEITSPRACMHAAAESVYYASVSNKKCMVEEIGTLGPMILDDALTPKYLDASMTTSFQYGATGYLWWCAFDQDQFDYAPYDVNAIEQNLGLAYSDATAKPILKRMGILKSELEQVGDLPRAKTDAVVILTADQDQWKVAYGAFMLALQAGFNVEFMYQSQPLKPADYYIIPCIQSCGGIPKAMNFELQKRIEAGAKLLITYNGGYIGYFNQLTGLQVAGREEFGDSMQFALGEKEIQIGSPVRLLLNAEAQNVISRDQKGRLVFTKYTKGKGEVYFLNVPVENIYTDTPHPEKTNWHEIYGYFLKDIDRPLVLDSDCCAVTYHPYDDGRIGVFISNIADEKMLACRLSDSYALSEAIYAELSSDVLTIDHSFAYLVLVPKK